MTPELLLPPADPITLLDATGRAVPGDGPRLPSDDVLLALYRMMVLGRRFDTQATALTKQGRLAVYP
jgi:pyruvate dehydrogenase E1 component alpha subunit